MPWMRMLARNLIVVSALMVLPQALVADPDGPTTECEIFEGEMEGDTYTCADCWAWDCRTECRQLSCAYRGELYEGEVECHNRYPNVCVYKA